jgi:5-methylcytosine-specific restriction protein A
MGLRDITRAAVLEAIAECDRLGRDEFLAKYGFDRARSYLLIHGGKAYDSKAIVGVAHRFLPAERALAARDFSGGEATVGRLLRGLGFTVQVGDLTTGELVRLLTRLNVYRSDGLPALYQPITLLWAFARAGRGEPRFVSWEETQRQVAALIKRHGRPGEGNRVYYPVAALYGAGLWELQTDSGAVPNAHGSSVPQRWFDEHQPRSGLVKSVYELVRDSADARATAVRALTDTYFVSADPAALLGELGLSGPQSSSAEAAFSALAAEYHHLCDRADVFWAGRESTRASRTSADPIRSDAARQAVLLRSEGRCENPGCTGDIHDVTDSGAPILEVDHIHDLALGGPDEPAQMVALCPNCHAIKTLGRTREDLRSMLLEVAMRRHEMLIDRLGSRGRCSAGAFVKSRSCRDRGNTAFEMGSCQVGITCHRAHSDGGGDDYVGELVEQIVRSPVGSLSFIEPVNSYIRVCDFSHFFGELE